MDFNTDPRAKNEWIIQDSIEAYFSEYRQSLTKALGSIDLTKLRLTYELMNEVVLADGIFFTAGNGGSAAIANHLCCDWTKGTYVEGKHRIRTVSLCSNVELMTALCNDFGADFVFSRQLKMLATKNDALFLVSSSGNSPNIIEACEMAKSLGIKCVGLSGFDGGKLSQIADISIHVPVNNYAVVEDAHQAIMQSLAQYFFLSRTQGLEVEQS